MISYLLKNPEIQIILFSSVLLPIVILGFKNVKKNLLLEIEIKIDRMLDKHELKLSALKRDVQFIEHSFNQFKDRIEMHLADLSNYQHNLEERLNKVLDLENEYRMTRELFTIQYADLKRRIEFISKEDSSMRNYKDTEVD